MSAFKPEDYTVGWVCAILEEFVAAVTMLDYRHKPQPQFSKDINAYELGSIGEHNVVIACLPLGKPGNTSSAIVAQHMVRSFGSIRFGLMVGIGGGSPNEENDIRLGDIVVSKPGKSDGGVIQYDYGRWDASEKFVHTHTLNKPPTVLLTALQAIQKNHVLGDRSYLSHLELKKSPQIPPETQKQYMYPGQDKDNYFYPNYNHAGNSGTCDQCDKNQIKARHPRNPPTPRIFYGTIASANQLMRDGKTREKTAKKTGALCFEMEAAGLVDDFPCIVIRGISDYADTHKNDQWKPYAALCAAAYAKDLLGTIPAQIVSKTPVIKLESSAVSDATVQDVPGHSTEQETTQVPNIKSFFVINPKVYSSTSVKLGRLTTDVQAPWEDFCPDIADPSPDRVGISPDTLLEDILQGSAVADFGRKLVNVLSKFFKVKDPISVIKASVGKSYRLTNSRRWFTEVCTSPKVRTWIEEIVKYGWDIYAVVGIHTIQVGALEDFKDEVIIAVQYRKVVFNWLEGETCNLPRLEIGSCQWQPLVITKASDELAGDVNRDILEAKLSEVVEEIDLKTHGSTFRGQNGILVV